MPDLSLLDSADQAISTTAPGTDWTCQWRGEACVQLSMPGIARARLSHLPGCAAGLILHGLRVEEAHRGRGYGRTAIVLQLATARHYGARLLMTTVNTWDSPIALHLLRRSGFANSAHYVNSRGQQVDLLTYSPTWGQDPSPADPLPAD